MQLTKFKPFILFSLITLPVSSCIYGDLDKMAFNEVQEVSLQYCQSQHLSSCDVYQRCFMDQLSLFKKGVASTIAPVMGSNTSPSEIRTNTVNQKYANINFKEMMNNIYSWVLEIEQKNLDSKLTDDFTLVLYIHNACADISGDKKYDIDRYIPAVEKKLKTANK